MNEDGKWITINGTHVFIKEGQNPMDAFIRKKKKEKDFNERYKIVDSTNKTQKGQSVESRKLEAIDKRTGKVVGSATYDYVNNFNDTWYKNKVNVHVIHVDEKYRRKGIGTNLYKELQKQAGNDDLYLSEVSREGQALVKSIGEVTKEELVPNYKKRGRKNPERWWVRIKE